MDRDTSRHQLKSDFHAVNSMHNIWRVLIGAVIVGAYMLIAWMLMLISAAEEAHFFPN